MQVQVRFYSLVARAVDGLICLAAVPSQKSGCLIVIYPAGLGDSIITIPGFLKAQELLGEPVTVMVPDSWCELAKMLSDKAAFITASNIDKNPFSRFRAGLRIRKHGFRYALRLQCAQNPLAAESILVLSGAEKKIALAWPGGFPEYEFARKSILPKMDEIVPLMETGWIAPTVAGFPQKRLPHVAERMYHALSQVTGKNIRPEPWRLVPAADNPLAGKKPYVIINLGGGYKLWPLENVALFTKKCVAVHARVVFAGGKAEKKIVSKLMALCQAGGIQTGDVEQAVDRYGLDELFAVIKGAQAFITTDTFLFHASVMIGTPTVCLYALDGTFGGIGAFVPYPPALHFGKVAYAVFKSLDEFMQVSPESVDKVFSQFQTIVTPP